MHADPAVESLVRSIRPREDFGLPGANEFPDYVAVAPDYSKNNKAFADHLAGMPEVQRCIERAQRLSPYGARPGDEYFHKLFAEEPVYLKIMQLAMYAGGPNVELAHPDIYFIVDCHRALSIYDYLAPYEY